MHVNWFSWSYISYYATEDDHTSGDESLITCDEGEVLSGDENTTGMHSFLKKFSLIYSFFITKILQVFLKLFCILSNRQWNKSGGKCSW